MADENFLIGIDFGETMLPSIIYTNEDGSVKVGQVAEMLSYCDSANGIFFNRNSLGTKKIWTCNGKTYTPTDVATEIFKEVRRQFIRRLRVDDDAKINAVITVPAYFYDNQRDEIKFAGEMAGFNVLALVDEPLAIVAETNAQIDKRILVVDIGKSHADFSIAENYKVISIDGDDRLGRDDFDNAIRNEFLHRIEENIGVKFTDYKSAGIQIFAAGAGKNL